MRCIILLSSARELRAAHFVDVEDTRRFDAGKPPDPLRTRSSQVPVRARLVSCSQLKTVPNMLRRRARTALFCVARAYHDKSFGFRPTPKFEVADCA